MKMSGVVIAILTATLSWTLPAAWEVSAQGKTQRDGIFTVAQATRGQALFAASCAACHGAEASGGDMGPSLTGPEFVASWDGMSVRDLFERINTSMPQGNPGSLLREQVADVVAFILSKNKFPAGDSELPFAADQLSQITFAFAK
jgi:S-disulfanyl-L-cysteine oxidoreductase SoxD